VIAWLAWREPRDHGMRRRPYRRERLSLAAALPSQTMNAARSKPSPFSKGGTPVDGIRAYFGNGTGLVYAPCREMRISAWEERHPAIISGISNEPKGDS